MPSSTPRRITGLAGKGLGARQFRVGIRLLDWTEGFAYRIFPGITRFLSESPRWQVSYEHRSCGDLAPLAIDADWEGDGLIVFRHTAEEARQWREKGIRVLNLSAETPDGEAFPRLTLDNGAAARRAVEYLSGLGLRDLAYWHDPERLYSVERREAFEAAAREAGCRVHPLVVPGANFVGEERRLAMEAAAEAQLAALPRPCGVFAKDDVAGLCVLKLCEKLGIRCPEDLAVVSLNDDPAFCEMTWPQLSSIRFPGRQFGYRAAELLHSMMTGRRDCGPWRELIPPGPVVPRQSTARVDLPDPLVSAAVAFIAREGSTRAVSVADVCHQLGVSREILRNRMVSATGRTPKQEIDRLRLTVLEGKLAFTDLTLEAIAQEMGFHGADDLSRFYRRLRKQPPGRFRSLRDDDGQE